MNLINEDRFKEVLEIINIPTTEKITLMNIPLNVPVLFKSFSPSFKTELTKELDIKDYYDSFIVYESDLKDGDTLDYMQNILLETDTIPVENTKSIMIEDDLLAILGITELNTVGIPIVENETVWDKTLDKNIIEISELLELMDNIKHSSTVNLDLDKIKKDLRNELEIPLLYCNIIIETIQGLIESEMPFTTLYAENVPKNIMSTVNGYLIDNNYISLVHKVYCDTYGCYSHSSKEMTTSQITELRYTLNYFNQFEDFNSIVWEHNGTDYKHKLLKPYNDFFKKGCLDCGTMLSIEDLIVLYKKYKGFLFTLNYYNLKNNNNH